MKRDSLVLVDGVFGSGTRVSLHSSGRWSGLAIGEYELIDTTDDPALPVGTTLAWDRESMAIQSVTTVAGSPNVHTYVLDRDDEQDHAGNDTDELYRVVPPSDLEQATIILAKRLQVREAQPEVQQLGETQPALMRDIDSMTIAYQRPASA